MLSPEIIARIKSLSLRGRHLATDVMTGDYASAFHGRGMEFLAEHQGDIATGD
jgi:hypothetical protein